MYVADAVPERVSDSDELRVAVLVGEGVAVAVAEPVLDPVPLEVRVGVGSTDAERVSVAGGVAESEPVAVDVVDAVAVTVLDAVTDAELLREVDALELGVGVGSTCTSTAMTTGAMALVSMLGSTETTASKNPLEDMDDARPPSAVPLCSDATAPKADELESSAGGNSIKTASSTASEEPLSSPPSCSRRARCAAKSSAH